ncbi:aminotransferase class V-fold PLP-dependent enzyme [Kordiimonas laminariae]|uniref:aminotransferase class V-fold PLP-dependent enzyme n=1 Tax=Kordiimonas laminariae TaxID=2917717 RepID=UPI001FF2E3CE|nr:aminotransferase class V-fold PLP-dependent enzyme [Kordiimonas laminariae]MCK0070977.1 aminotransferase class V-fold PLP-dependent enzyme [Kordiimonas laminariae]
MTDFLSNFSSLELEKMREITPGAAKRLHLDNCGAALMPEPVINAIQSHLDQEVRMGGYVAQEQQSAVIDGVYNSLSRLIGGSVQDFAITGSAVDAWTKAFYSVPMKEGDNIITAYNEYCSNYVAYLHRAKRRGIEVRVAYPKSDGQLDLNQLESLIDDKTKLISVTHVPSSSGQILPVEEIGKIAKAKDILYLVDTCQSVGQLPVKVESVGCDMATGTARKFLRGPRGMGFLYMNEKARNRIEPVVATNKSAAWIGDQEIEFRSDTALFEAWERNIGNQIAFGAAIDYLLELGLEKATEEIQHRAAYLRQNLYNIKGVIPTCQEDATAAIITFNKEGHDATTVKAKFHDEGVGVQVSTIEHTRLDLGARGINTTIRVSPHYYNSKEELDRFLNMIEAL